MAYDALGINWNSHSLQEIARQLTTSSYRLVWLDRVFYDSKVSRSGRAISLFEADNAGKFSPTYRRKEMDG